jgi:phosphoribosylformylglycinamidine synthase
MDLKKAQNLLFAIGVTGAHLGGSHATLVLDEHGLGQVPTVNAQRAKTIFSALHRAICDGLVRSCHDLSEGGLAACVSEMAFAGGLGASIDASLLPVESNESLTAFERLFSESNSRFLCEVEPQNREKFWALFPTNTVAEIGLVTESSQVKITDGAETLVCESLAALKQSWQKTFDWK